MIVIATNNGYSYLPKLIKSLEKTNIFNIPISIIDTGSNDKSFLNYLDHLPSKYQIFKIKEGYDTGAYIYAYENIKSDYYIFLHDSIEILTDQFFKICLDQVTKESLFAYYSFENRQDFKEELSPYFENSILDSYKFGVFGPMFACSKKIMKQIYDSNLYFLPKNKMEQMAMERGWGIITYILNIPIVCIDHYDVLLNNASPYMKKHFIKRT